MDNKKQMTNEEIKKGLVKIESRGYQLAALVTAAVTIGMARYREEDDEIATLCFSGMHAEDACYYIACLASDLSIEIQDKVDEIQQSIIKM